MFNSTRKSVFNSTFVICLIALMSINTDKLKKSSSIAVSFFLNSSFFRGDLFYKEHHYLITTFHVAKSTQLQIVEKLDSLARILEADLKKHLRTL